MDLIRQSIDRPIAVIAAVLMVILFGTLALETIPVQLAPDVREPTLTVTTQWPGAAPAEIEREIINRQEEVLKGLEGLVEMTSSSETGTGVVDLEFRIGQDMDRALLLVANRLDDGAWEYQFAQDGATPDQEQLLRELDRVEAGVAEGGRGTEMIKP